jgi:prolyl-tRNA synthetase
VEAESGAIGGDVNHEFVVLAESGESEIFLCECGYAANDERAVSRGAGLAEREPTDGPTRVDTPDRSTIEDVTAFLGVHASRLVKTLLYRAGERVVAALVPGERQLNEIQLAKAVGGVAVELLGDTDIESLTGAKVGYAGPVGLPSGVTVVADTLLDDYEGMIVGANETDAHLRGVKMGRDFTPDASAPISMPMAGDTCAQCGKGRLTTTRGVELGHIFKLDTKYSAAMKATYLDADGNENPYIMGCYGFGVSRAVAAAIEQHHDEKGIRWPKSITPYHVVITPIKLDDGRTAEVAEQLYADLQTAGYDVVLDDRDLRPGPKFKDAELIGVPLRVTVGERNLKNGQVELYDRHADSTELLAVDGVVEAVKAYYAAP